MQAMVLEKIRSPLALQQWAIPSPCSDEILIRVKACGVCRTDLHIAEGDLIPPKLPLILGHQIVGEVVEVGTNAAPWKAQDRVGVPWLASTCRQCRFCVSGRENLCDGALFTGYNVQGGFAQYATCKAAYAIDLPKGPSAVSQAPLLCAGLIGFRAYTAVKSAEVLGFYGFGSSAHILLQLAVQEGKKVFVFTRPQDEEGKKLALEMGAMWVGDSTSSPPEKLQGAIVFAPLGDCMVWALQALDKGGICVSAGIHMTDIPSFPYQDLFFEKTLTCVSHLTRQDAKEFFGRLRYHPISTKVHTYALQEANTALQDIRDGRKKGSFVLDIDS